MEVIWETPLIKRELLTYADYSDISLKITKLTPAKPVI